MQGVGAICTSTSGFVCTRAGSFPPRQALPLSSHLISSIKSEETCSYFIRGKFRVVTRWNFSKLCFQSFLGGHHLHFLNVSHKSLRSHGKMTPHTPLPRENARELTWGDEVISSLAPSSSPAIKRCPGPNAAPVGHLHKPCPAQGLHTQPGSMRRQPPLGGKGREGCSALLGQSSFCRRNRGKNGENHPYVFSSRKASVTQTIAVGFQKERVISTESLC